MAHPSGVTVDIVGTEVGESGRSCDDHEVCGSVLELDMVVCLRQVQILIKGKEESAIAAYWVTDGVDRCRVGFLPRHCLKHAEQFEGKLAQIIDIYKDSDSPTKRKKHYHNKGCVHAAIIDTVKTEGPPAKKQRVTQEDK